MTEGREAVGQAASGGGKRKLRSRAVLRLGVVEGGEGVRLEAEPGQLPNMANIKQMFCLYNNYKSLLQRQYCYS